MSVWGSPVPGNAGEVNRFGLKAPVAPAAAGIGSSRLAYEGKYCMCLVLATAEASMLGLSGTAAATAWALSAAAGEERWSQDMPLSKSHRRSTQSDDRALLPGVPRYNFRLVHTPSPTSKGTAKGLAVVVKDRIFFIAAKILGAAVPLLWPSVRSAPSTICRRPQGGRRGPCDHTCAIYSVAFSCSILHMVAPSHIRMSAPGAELTDHTAFTPRKMPATPVPVPWPATDTAFRRFMSGPYFKTIPKQYEVVAGRLNVKTDAQAEDPAVAKGAAEGDAKAAAKDAPEEDYLGRLK